MMVDPTVAPMVSAKSFPSTTGGNDLPVLQASSVAAHGSSAAADPSFMDFSSSPTRFSYSGITPFNSAPLALAERDASHRRRRLAVDSYAAWLHGFRDFAHQLDPQEAAVKGSAPHLHIVRKAELAFERTVRDAAV